MFYRSGISIFERINIKFKKMKNIFLLIAAMLVGSIVFAQEAEMKPEKYTDVTWHEIVLVKVQPGKTGEVKKIMEEFKAAGDPADAPEVYWFMTGEYDMMFIWPMKGGPADMEWKRSESSIKWYKKLIEQQGGPEKAEELIESYQRLLKGGESFVVIKEK